MKEIFLFLLFLFSFFDPTYSQKFLFKGKIVEESTNEAIPYATIEIKNTGKGTATNETGVFELAYQIKKEKSDTLLVKALGYADKEIALIAYISNPPSLIKLIPATFNISPITVRWGDKTLIKGINIPDTKPASSFTMGSQIAVFMNNKEQHTGWIASVSFFIVKRNSKFKAPFRVRLYEVDENGFPGKDLIKAQIIVSAKKKNAWLDVNLEEYAIRLPPKGFFVAFEWIYTDKKYFYDAKFPKETIQLYGTSLGRTIYSDTPITFIGRTGYTWRLDDYLFQGKYGNSLIRSTIRY